MLMGGFSYAGPLWALLCKGCFTKRVETGSSRLGRFSSYLIAGILPVFVTCHEFAQAAR